jgi:murein tripeptide amidase MpaA
LAIRGHRIVRLVTVPMLIALWTAAACAPSRDNEGDSRTPAPARVGGTPLPGLPFDHILDYDGLTELLQGWAAARPDICDVRSVGTSPGGRELWFVTITNRATGPAIEKPALLVDGNMHALEWTGGVAALNFIWTLLRDYDTEERTRRLVDTRCVYVLPRLSPDGVEATLREGRIIRSAVRSKTDGAPIPGLQMHDIDGDGQVVFMRFHDPSGPWKAFPGEPRLLVARRPDEAGGEYWRVVPEGTITGYDGETITVPAALEGLDFGVFFPDDRDTFPPGATSAPDARLVPEVAAYVDAIKDRPNIIAHVTCHSFGGAVLIPPINPNEQMSSSDRLTYAVMGEKAVGLMNYEVISYLDLRAGQMLDVHIPTEIGWFYNTKGVWSFITEFWNPLRAAGITLKGSMSLWLGGLHPVEDELRLLRWNDEDLGGRGFVPWHAFNHPQLGPVEIGGWDKIHYWYNVPFERLQREVAPHADWLAYLALSSPRLEIRRFSAEPSGNDEWRIRLVVENTGWLPTNGSQRALDRKIVGGIVAELALPSGARIVEGDLRREIGQLAGRSEQRSTATWWGYSPGTPDRAVIEWRIAAPEGTTVSVAASQARAGTARASLLLRSGPPK